MLFPTYKAQVRQAIKLWLNTECDGEALNDKWANNVAQYLYANEYDLEDKEETQGLDIMLYDYERMTAYLREQTDEAEQ
jgi:hypothetical protein